MFAARLLKENGVSRNLSKAESVLDKSCTSGEDDPASQMAQRLRETIAAERGAD